MVEHSTHNPKIGVCILPLAQEKRKRENAIFSNISSHLEKLNKLECFLLTKEWHTQDSYIVLILASQSYVFV